MASLPRVLVLGLILAAPPQQPAEAPRVAPVSLSFAGRELRVSARLSPALPPEVSQRLISGLPTTTRWEIGLYAFRTFWPDTQKDQRIYSVTATYRPTTGDFTVEKRLDSRLLETTVVATRNEAAETLSTLPALPCFIMGDHLDGKTMTVKVRCVYAAGVSLGVVPTSVETGLTLSEPFTWHEEPPR